MKMSETIPSPLYVRGEEMETRGEEKGYLQRPKGPQSRVEAGAGEDVLMALPGPCILLLRFVFRGWGS